MLPKTAHLAKSARTLYTKAMAELSTDTSRQEKDLRFIQELTSKALGQETLGGFWPIIEESLVRYFGCDRATLYFVDKVELRSMFARGLDSSVVLRLGDGIAGKVAMLGGPIVVNDPYGDQRFHPAYDRATGYKTENLACAPFTHENQAVGVVELLNKPGGFTPEDEASLRSFSPHIGFCIVKLYADQKNRELQARLAQVTKMATLGTLVGGMVHEIGTPLTAIEVAVSRLQGAVAPDSVQHADLEQLRQQVVRCMRIARNMLDFARRSEFILETVSVGKALDATLALAEHSARLQGVAIERQTPADLPAVRAADDQLQQVFLNLITNALQAMPRGGTLRIAGSRKGGFVEIAFSDDGQGIEPTDMAQVFEPFFTTRPKGIGTGLGLPICRDLVARCGGKLTAHSEGPGKGATFLVELPIAP